MSWSTANVTGTLKKGESVIVWLVFFHEDPLNGQPEQNMGGQFLLPAPLTFDAEITTFDQIRLSHATPGLFDYGVEIKNTGDFTTFWRCEGGGFQ
jgi:hypothetical protein